MINSIKKISKFDKIIMLIRRKYYLVCLDHGCNPEITFKNGEIYSCAGNRVSDVKLEIYENSIAIISDPKIGRSKNNSEIIKIIQDDLKRDKIMTIVIR